MFYIRISPEGKVDHVYPHMPSDDPSVEHARLDLRSHRQREGLYNVYGKCEQVTSNEIDGMTIVGCDGPRPTIGVDYYWYTVRINFKHSILT